MMSGNIGYVSDIYFNDVRKALSYTKHVNVIYLEFPSRFGQLNPRMNGGGPPGGGQTSFH